MIIKRFDKTGEEWTRFEMLFSNRHMTIFKLGMRTCVHVDVEGTGKRFIFIAKKNGDFLYYIEDHWHPDSSQGAPVCIYEWDVKC